MSFGTELLKLMMKVYRISHGDKELAQKWLYKVANAVTGHEPLSVSEASFVAGILRANGYLGNATHFWTLGKTQDPRPNIAEEWPVWTKVQEKMQAGKPKDPALTEVARELGFFTSDPTKAEYNEGMDKVEKLYRKGQERYTEFCQMYFDLPDFNNALKKVLEDLKS